ncbi:Monocarboxylate transporter 13 [Portunus trituberculatus]|uniref:Monocarboxylate transporter 13 n=1 Tax=Portunus trituberculatus TaxID=210409 RepID=A0A5B7D225_PORTR|nr:Monocarboxylate transporter 13 [Portunus trituberculatus]
MGDRSMHDWFLRGIQSVGAATSCTKQRKNMKTKEALHKLSQESRTDTAEMKTVPHQGWAALSMASLFEYSFGTIFSEYLIELGTSPTKISWICNLLNVSACLGSVMGATLVDEFGWRKVIFVSGLLTSLAMALSAFTTSADFLFFSYSILAEAWLDMTEKVFNPEVKIYCYTLLHKDKKIKNGGGVTLHVMGPVQCCINSRIKRDSKAK